MASSGIAESTEQTHLKGMSKDDIPPPKRPAGDPDRFLECQESLEVAFQSLIARAVEAGWTEAETCAAVIELTDHHMLAMVENDYIAEQIATYFKKT